MYKITIHSRRKRTGIGTKVPPLFVEFEFKDKDICELSYSNLYCNRDNLPMCSEVVMYDGKSKKIKLFMN